MMQPEPKPYIATNGFIFPAHHKGGYAVPGGERTNNKEALDALAVKLKKAISK